VSHSDKTEEHSGPDDVEDRRDAGAHHSEHNGERREHHPEDHQHGDELVFGDGFGLRRERGNGDEQRDTTHTEDDRADRNGVKPHFAHAGVDNRRDDEGDRTERLHHDERREDEARELENDRETQHDGADDPGRALQQGHQLAEGQPSLRAGGGRGIHLRHTAVLELGAEGQEDGADERNRNTQGLLRRERYLVGEVS
jgi:hypothetical protein